MDLLLIDDSFSFSSLNAHSVVFDCQMQRRTRQHCNAQNVIERIWHRCGRVDEFDGKCSARRLSCLLFRYISDRRPPLPPFCINFSSQVCLLNVARMARATNFRYTICRRDNGVWNPNEYITAYKKISWHPNNYVFTHETEKRERERANDHILFDIRISHYSFVWYRLMRCTQLHLLQLACGDVGANCGTRRKHSFRHKKKYEFDRRTDFVSFGIRSVAIYAKSRAFHSLCDSVRRNFRAFSLFRLQWPASRAFH